MDKLRFLTESRNGKESVIEKLIHKDNSSSNRISCRIAEKSDIKSMMDVCFTRQKWMSERGLGCVVFKETREYYRQKIREHKMMVCVQDDKVLGFCIVSKQDLAEHWPTSLKDGYDGVYVFDCMSLPNTGQEILRLLFDHIMKTFQSDIRLDMEIPNDRLESFYKDRLGFSVVGKSAKEGTTHLLMEKTYTDISESFTRKIRSKKNDELTAKADTAFVPDGVYILHETLGVKGVEGWNPRNNDGVVGILLIEDDHKIVVATEDSPENLTWSEKLELINQPIEELEDAESDFNGEIYCRRLDSPDFPAAYYCKTYNKGNRDWYLPSSGELWLIYNHLGEIQTALSIVGGQEFVTTRDEGIPLYWSSTEHFTADAWYLHLTSGSLCYWCTKVSDSPKVRPVSKFDFSTLKESFTRKIRSKKNDELTTKPAFEIPDGVYILHETLGVCEIDSWDSGNNDGVEGILVKDNDTKLIVSVDEFTEIWARKLQSKFNVNKTFIYSDSLNASDKKKYTGKILCQKLNSPDFPAAYRCLCYHKGNINNWYLPSIQELYTIAEHRHEIQKALIKVNGDILKFSGENVIILKSRSGQGGNWYWSSTESHREKAWSYNFDRDIDNGWTRKSENSLQVRPVAYFGEDSGLEESFTRKISRKNNDELISKADTAFVPDGVYILHETLGVKTVDGWNPKDNDGVVGILLIEDEHQIVIALEDSPKNLIWSEEYNFVNRPIKNSKTAKSDFNGEKYCRNLNSPDFPAAYYCLNYNKGGRDWYLPSMGELWLIRNHLEEIQTASSTVGRQRSVFTWDEFAPCFWSSTERDVWSAWVLNFGFRGIPYVWYDKVGKSFNVLPISKFQPSELKESFTKKISSKKNTDLISKPSFVLEDGVYILHETLGVKGVEGWNPKDNKGVVGILLVEDDHKIVVALEDSPDNLPWSKKCGLINQPIEKLEDAESDFNGEVYCQKLNSPDFPAAYYCKTYNKGGRSWKLPSFGELWLIYNHLEEIQNALSIVGGQKFVTEWDYKNVPLYWSSTEHSATYAWLLYLGIGNLIWRNKVSDSAKVRPVSKLDFSTLKESFTKKIKKTSNKDLVAAADKLASTNYDYNEVNFTRKLRKETEQYYKSEFYKVYHYPLDYRHNGDIWPADEDGFHNMYLESTYWAEKNEEVDFEGYFNDDTNNCAEPADVGVFVFGYGKDCVAYGEYNEYAETHQLIESFTAKTKNINNKDLQNKSDNVFNLDTLLREYVKSHCRPGSHNYDFYFSEENRPVFSDKEWKKLQGITVVKEIDDYYVPLHVVTPHGSTISNDFLPNVDDVFLFYIYRRRKFHIPVNRLPEKLLQELMEWILNINESFTRKTKQKSAEDIKQKADESVNLENLVKEIVLENDSFKENDQMLRIFRNRQPRCTHALNKLRVRPTSDPTLSPYAIQGMVVLDESFYFKPEKYNISSLLAKDLTRKAMKDLYNSNSIIVLNRIYTMEYRGKEFLRTEFNILRYNERYGRYSDVMNPQEVYFEFTDLPKELRLDIYRFLRKKFTEK